MYSKRACTNRHFEQFTPIMRIKDTVLPVRVFVYDSFNIYVHIYFSENYIYIHISWIKCNLLYQTIGSGGSTGGGGVGGLNPPPPLGLPSKNLMCIEKRHHNMSRPTQYVPIALCLRLSLRQ